VRKAEAPVLAVCVGAAIVVVGTLLWIGPYLTRTAQPVSGVPAPSALDALTEFSVAPRRQACLSTVTIDPNSRQAQFELRPAKPTSRGGPPVELVLSASDYRSTALVPGGYPGGSAAVAIAPPRHSVIGTACFVNRGSSPVLLVGTSEPRTISRSAMVVDGKPVVGDVALTFLDSGSRSLLDRLGEIFGHASNLTDRLIPVWLIWALAILVGIGVPVLMLAAFYRAVREDEVPM
jgi:hypothetical protein